MMSVLKLVGSAALGALLIGCASPSTAPKQQTPAEAVAARETIWDLFDQPDPNVNIRVNKYLWVAALEVLDFLPVEGADPFTGIIVMDWGRAPGSNVAYRGTVYIQDPALEARSLKVALQTRSGPASDATVRAIEDAILTRARQLRIRDSEL